MSNLNWVDIVFLAIFLFSIIAGFGRGFVREIISLATLIVAFFIATTFCNQFANYLLNLPFIQSLVNEASGATGANAATPASYLAWGVSFGILFLATVMLGSLVAYFLNAAFQTGILGIGNRILGGLFGLIRGYILVLVIIFVVQLTPLSSQSWWAQSQIVNSYQPAVAWLGGLVAPALANIKNRLGQTIQGVGNQLNNMTNF